MNISNLSNLNSDGKIIFKNFSYLSLLRVFNVLSQYILVSFLIRVLGNENYGIFVWGFSIIQYLNVFINFGFNSYAAKYISEKKEDISALSKVFSSIMTIKISLFLISGIFLLLSLNFYPMLLEHAQLLFILMGFALGEALFPLWFFQGQENLKLPTKIVFIFRLLLVILTLWLVSQKGDLLLYASLLTFSQIFIGLSGLVFALSKFKIKLVGIDFANIIELLKESFVFFIGALFGKTFNFAAIMLLGIFCTMEDVGSFDASFKILAVMQLPFETLSMVLFPTIARSKDLFLNQKIILIGFLLSLILWAFTYWNAGFLMRIIGGAELENYDYLLQKLSILIPIVVITYLLGANTLIAFGHQKHYNISFIIPAILYLFSLLFFWKMDRLNFETIILLRILVEALMAAYRLIAATRLRLIFVSK